MGHTETFEYAVTPPPLKPRFDKAQAPSAPAKSLAGTPFVKALGEAAGAFLIAMVLRR